MLDITKLQGPLTVTETPGMNTLDPRFSEIATLAQNAHYEEAAERVQSAFDDDIYDIRTIGYFLYGFFLQEGLVGLGPIYDTLVGLLEDDWEAIGPIKKKEKQAEKGISWLNGKLLKVLQHHKDKEDETWKRWQADLAFDEVDGTIDSLARFHDAFASLMDSSDVTNQLSRLEGWLNDLLQLLEKPAEPEPEPEPEPEEEPAEAESSPDTASAEPHPEEGELYVGASYPLRQLKKKLDAFERLVHRAEIGKASLVADDIAATIDDFDPTVYLPELFREYFSLLSRNIEEISRHWEARDSLTWQAMERLYKVDVDAFMEL